MAPRLVYSREELFAEHPYQQRLEFLGKRLHGGLLADGTYRSPRTLFRAPAIAAWSARLAAEGQPARLIGHDAVPTFFPNVAQSKLLLCNGVVEPICRMLTMTAMVEGDGKVGMEMLPKPPLAALIKESIEGTTLDHLYKGLLEAHGLDEAGSDDEGGHKTMWEVARDLALDNPAIPTDIPVRVMGPPDEGLPRFHPEIPRPLEVMLTSLISLLAMEVFADSAMAWARTLLSDPAVSRHAEAAGMIVSCIRQDETIHVDYLTTAMLELRARTLLTDDGEVPARPIIDEIVARVAGIHVHQRTQVIRNLRYEYIKKILSRHSSGDRILHEFDRLDDTRATRQDTGSVTLREARTSMS